MGLDLHSERIDELWFKEEQEPTATQAERATVLRALLEAKDGKMLAKDARRQLGLS